MEACCWENEQYEKRTKQSVNQAHRFIAKRFRCLNVGKGSYSELFVFSIRGHVEVRQKPNDTESGENGSRRCPGRISFSWFSYRTLSLPLRYRNRSFASRSGIPLRPSSKKSAISNFDVSYPIQEETVLSERIRLSGNGKRNMHRRFFIYYRSFSAVSGGVIKIIKFSFPAKSCISIYPG